MRDFFFSPLRHRVVEFFDSRNAGALYDGLHGKEWNGSQVEITFMWDVPLEM